MKHWRTVIRNLPTDYDVIRKFAFGISLHGHTQHSRENLGFIERFVQEIPILVALTRDALRRYRERHGKKLDFSRAYWTAPVSAHQAYAIEKGQIEDALDLASMVSLTDHDDIEAGLSLHAGDPRHIPVSLEWTVPFPPAELHVGIHNLPPADARKIMSALSSYTAAPEESKLAGLFEHLDQFPGVLVVLNHPLWEMEPIGERAVRGTVRTFLARYGRWIHALEVNGLRPWRENRWVIEMGRNLNYPVVSGGDRHGREPSAMLNLTNAATFAEFVSEVREGGACEIVTMPQYREPFNLRVLQVVWDVLRNERGLAGEERRWTERVFFELTDGVPRPLSQCWEGEPTELRLMMAFTRALEAPPLRAALRLAFAGEEREAL
jgi:hypothetical protein